MLSVPWFNNRAPPGQTPSKQYTSGICTLIFYPLHATQSLRPSDANTRQWGSSSLVGVMVCRLFGAKPLPEPMRLYCQFNPKEQHSPKLLLLENAFENIAREISPAKYRHILMHFFQILNNYPISTFCGPPTTYRMMTQTDLKASPWKHQRHFISGGEPLVSSSQPNNFYLKIPKSWAQ